MIKNMLNLGYKYQEIEIYIYNLFFFKAYHTHKSHVLKWIREELGKEEKHVACIKLNILIWYAFLRKVIIC